MLLCCLGLLDGSNYVIMHSACTPNPFPLCTLLCLVQPLGMGQHMNIPYHTDTATPDTHGTGGIAGQVCTSTPSPFLCILICTLTPVEWEQHMMCNTLPYNTVCPEGERESHVYTKSPSYIYINLFGMQWHNMNGVLHSAL